MPDNARYRVGVDVGGTFTDLILVDNDTGAQWAAKSLNRSADQSETVVEGLIRLLGEAGIGAGDVGWISHGTTITTNAVIERKGAKTALITNKNFRDILEIGRFARPADLIYRIHDDKPAPLVPRFLRLGIDCRVDRAGEIVADIDDRNLTAAIEAIRDEGVTSVAVCFLFSFLNPAHEESVRSALTAAIPDLNIVLSSEILREFREYPRTSTTVFAAYVAPVLRRYVSALVRRLGDVGIGAPLYIFQSNGGVARPDIVMRNPALTLLSGPAGAVVGAAQLCGRAGYRDLLTMDIGGTSLDVCMVRDGVAEAATNREIDFFPIAVPMLDVHTVGAGGGSVVRVDDVGRVSVGPDSMGARPGPACYGLGGDQATLTDVNLLLGLLDPDTFADGAIPLNRARAESAVERWVARPLGMDIEAAAAGVYRVATNQIAEAIRTVTVERGADPRDFALVAFGGGGPLHAAAVARELGVARIVIPRHPGLFSAQGIAISDVYHDYIQSTVRPVSEISPDEIRAILGELEQRAATDLDAEGIASDRRRIAPALDLRYVGQTTEITVPLSVEEAGIALDRTEMLARFHALHERLYSYCVPDEPVELVNVRLRATGLVDKPPIAPAAGAARAPRPTGNRLVVLPDDDGARSIDVYRRDALAPGSRLTGPALIEESSSTTVLLSGMELTVDSHDNMIISIPLPGEAP